MKTIDLGTTVKWQKTDDRSVPDIRRKVVDEISLPSDLMLEIGCAAGNFFDCLPNSNRKNYIGIDLDSEQINKAKLRFPDGTFIYGDILDFNNVLKSCKTIVSFQVFEHIENDFALFDKIDSGKKMIFSVPNFPYRGAFPDGHKRYYEVDGWIKRYEKEVDFSEAWIIKHYKKNRKIFVFQGVRK